MKGQIIKGLKWTTFSTVVLALAGILKISVLARYLDKADFGLIAIVTFILGFIELFNEMGLASAILHRKNISTEEYSSLYWLNLAVSLFLYAFLWIITPAISGFYGESLLQILIPLVGLNIIFSGLGRQFRVIDQKKLLFKPMSLINIFAATISVILAIYLAVEGYGIYALVYASIAQGGLANALFVIFGLQKQKIDFHFKFQDTKPFLGIGLYQLGGQVVNYFNRDLDILIIGKFFSAEILGGYSLAKQLVYKPTQIINPILTQIASPSLALFQDNIDSLKKNYLKLLHIVWSINFWVYLGLLFFAPIAVDILYGNEYGDIVILVQILCGYMMLRSIGNPIGSLVIATGRTDLDFYWNLAALLIVPGFIFIGAQFNIVYVTLFNLLSMVVLFIPAWYFLVYKMTGISLKEYMKALIPTYFFTILNPRRDDHK